MTAYASEREKYQALLEQYPQYGSSHHGSGAHKRVTAATILDVGCGDNAFVLEARRRGRFAIGVDFAHPGADVIAEAERLPFADRSFELVTAFDVLEHLPPENVDGVLEELARVAHRFILSIAHRPSRFGGPAWELHLTIKPRGWWLEKLRAVGRVEEAGGYILGEFQAPGAR